MAAPADPGRTRGIPIGEGDMDWTERNKASLLRFLQGKPNSFGLFVVYADTLPNSFGYWAFGCWVPGVTVGELRAFWAEHSG